MRLAVRHRRSVATWLAGLLLLVQLMTAAYACTVAAAPSQQAVAVEQALMAECDGAGHADMAPDLTPLCRLHCGQDTQSANPPAGFDLASTSVAVPLLLWVLPTLALPASTSARSRAPVDAAPRGSPPLFLALLTLRN